MLDLDLGYINLGKFFFFFFILLIWKTRELDQVSNNSLQFKILEFSAKEEDQAMLPTYHITQVCL